MEQLLPALQAPLLVLLASRPDYRGQHAWRAHPGDHRDCRPGHPGPGHLR